MWYILKKILTKKFLFGGIPEEYKLVILTSKNKILNNENTTLRQQLLNLESEKDVQAKIIQDLQDENSRLKIKLETQSTYIDKLQKMLRSTLKFSEKVRSSRLGKIFFRKQLKELDTGSQLQEKEETTDSQSQNFDDIEF